MSTKRAIKRMLLTLMWLGVAAGMFMLIAAAMKVQQASTCKEYIIAISGSPDGKLFTTKEQVVSLLKAATKGDIKGQRKSDFNLPAIEDLLEQSSWVYNAELFFDNQDILHVNVVERVPLARVFTTDGTSFYIDETGRHIPLSDKITVDVPVFTGYPDKKIFNAADSTLIQNIIATASFISTDSFWTAQVSEVNIAPCGADCWNMEMIPVVGNHKVDLGDGSDIASKFHRLYLFYDQVLKRTGFDKYQKVDVQYDGQIVGIKGNYTKVDSLQLRKNIEELLQQSRKSNEMIEVAPLLSTKNNIAIDTSAEAKRIYQPVEGADNDSLSLQAEGIKQEEKIARPIEKKETKKDFQKAETPKKIITDKKETTEKAAIKTTKDKVVSSTTVQPVKKPVVKDVAKVKEQVEKAAVKTTPAGKKPAAKK